MKDTSELLERVHQVETEIEKVKDELKPPDKSIYQKFIKRPARFLSQHWGIIFSLVIALFVYWRYGISYFEPQKNIALAKATADSYVKLGDRLMLNGEFPAAKEAYNAAVKASQSSVGGTLGLQITDVLEPLPGQRYIVPEVENTKIDHLQAIIDAANNPGGLASLNPFRKKEDDKTYIVSYFRGSLAEQQFDYASAKTYYKESTDRNPDFIFGYTSSAYVNILAGDPIDTAVDTLKTAVRRSNTSAIALNNLGYCYLLKLDFATAECLFGASFNISPYLEAYVNLGDTYRLTGRPGLALSFHESALRLLKDKDNEKENSVAGQMAINFMPIKVGDVKTSQNFITVGTMEEKKALIYYELTLDYALTGDLKKAADALANAASADTDKHYEAFIKNKTVSFISLSKAPVDEKARALDKKARAWLTRAERNFPDAPVVNESKTTCPTLTDILDKK